MSNIPKEPHSWPADAEGEAASGNLRRQITEARQRMSDHWKALGSHGVSMNDAGEEDSQA